jgi:hypothetical protein
MTEAAGRTLTQTALLKGNQMKNTVVALATGLMIVSLGMPISAAAQDSTTGTSVKDRKTVAYSLRMTAEVISVNRGAQALTVKTVDNGSRRTRSWPSRTRRRPCSTPWSPGTWCR